MAQFIGHWDGHNFALFGDFNVVLRSEERLGVHGFGSVSKEFLLLVESLGLQNLPLVGLEFNFFEDGSRVAYSRLDKFLVRDSDSN